MKINEKLKIFNIEVDDIENVNFDDGMMREIARKYADEFDLIRLELVLNENIITAKDKFTGIPSYMGMKVSLEPLEKDISFIVRPTDKPTYDQLQQENQQLKEQLSKILTEVSTIEHNLEKYEEIGLESHFDYALHKTWELKEYLIDLLDKAKESK